MKRNPEPQSLRDRGLCAVVVPTPNGPRFGMCPLDELGQVLAEARVKGVPIGVLGDSAERELFISPTYEGHTITWCGAGPPPVWLDEARWPAPGDA